LNLLKGVYNRIQKDYTIPQQVSFIYFCGRSRRFRPWHFIHTGSCSIGAFIEMLKLPLSEYDAAQYAYHIERNDLQLAEVNKTSMQQHLAA